MINFLLKFIEFSTLKDFLTKLKNILITDVRLRLWLVTVYLGLLTVTLPFLPNLSYSTIYPNTLLPSNKSLQPLKSNKGNHEIMGFAPFWTIDKLDAVDFNTLTTLAYFGVPVQADGNLDYFDSGYQTFRSKKATSLFKKAHQNGTKVVLTLTQMNNSPIISLLDNPEAETRAISLAVDEVENRGIDGVNVDFEFSGDPGDYYRNKFTNFVANLSEEMHRRNPESFVTVSVYASSVKDPKIYDISALSEVSDGIFMMAYDYANTSSDHAIPTSPLYGYKEGKYWYDVSTAVEDFLTQMPAEKLILGVPWYGYNYLVYEPGVKAETRPGWTWRGRPVVQTYASVTDGVRSDNEDLVAYQSGWDEDGKVSWRAYFDPSGGTWRQVFIEDPTSLSIKYDFAKDKNLLGVGIWALGFDDGKTELWDVLKNKFGTKTIDAAITFKTIMNGEEG